MERLLSGCFWEVWRKEPIVLAITTRLSCPVASPQVLGSENPRGPECDILVTAGGHLQVSRARGGVTQVHKGSWQKPPACPHPQDCGRRSAAGNICLTRPFCTGCYIALSEEFWSTYIQREMHVPPHTQGSLHPPPVSCVNVYMHERVSSRPMCMCPPPAVSGADDIGRGK